MGLPPAGVPGAVPSMLPPPMPTGLMPPPPPLPGVPGIPALPGAPSLPAGMMLPAPRGQPKVVARPEVLGVLVGDDPQAILAHGDLVVVARVGERTPWGVIVGVRPGAVVLRTAAGTIVIPVHLDGVR